MAHNPILNYAISVEEIDFLVIVGLQYRPENKVVSIILRCQSSVFLKMSESPGTWMIIFSCGFFHFVVSLDLLGR